MRGVHITADLFGCRDPAGLMRDGAALAALCEQLASAAGLRVVARQFHAFAPLGDGGHTGVLLLAESHLAVHTWPELQAVTLDVYVCNYGADNSARAEALLVALLAAFAPQRVERHALRRGVQGAGR